MKQICSRNGVHASVQNLTIYAQGAISIEPISVEKLALNALTFHKWHTNTLLCFPPFEWNGLFAFRLCFFLFVTHLHWMDSFIHIYTYYDFSFMEVTAQPAAHIRINFFFFLYIKSGRFLHAQNGVDIKRRLPQHTTHI